MKSTAPEACVGREEPLEQMCARPKSLSSGAGVWSPRAIQDSASARNFSQRPYPALLIFFSGKLQQPAHTRLVEVGLVDAVAVGVTAADVAEAVNPGEPSYFAHLGCCLLSAMYRLSAGVRRGGKRVPQAPEITALVQSEPRSAGDPPRIDPRSSSAKLSGLSSH